MACTFSMLPQVSGSSSEYCSIWERNANATDSGNPANMSSIMVIMTRMLFHGRNPDLLPPGCLIATGVLTTLP